MVIFYSALEIYRQVCKLKLSFQGQLFQHSSTSSEFSELLSFQNCLSFQNSQRFQNCELSELSELSEFAKLSELSLHNRSNIYNCRARSSQDTEPVAVNGARWQLWVAEYILFYSEMLRLLLPRFFRMDLTATRNSYMLFRFISF